VWRLRDTPRCAFFPQQLLVDLFINYDCDLESSNLFERTVNLLVKVAQQPARGDAVMSDTQSAALRLDAMQCLVRTSPNPWSPGELG
jgi:hypothetical protein